MSLVQGDIAFLVPGKKMALDHAIGVTAQANIQAWLLY
jgi:hypothetical protein